VADTCDFRNSDGDFKRPRTSTQLVDQHRNSDGEFKRHRTDNLGIHDNGEIGQTYVENGPGQNSQVSQENTSL
jgi:hypothetical protein